MSVLATVKQGLFEAEDDVRSVGELLKVIEALGRLGRDSRKGLEAEECDVLYQLAIVISDRARRVEGMWDASLIALAGEV